MHASNVVQREVLLMAAPDCACSAVCFAQLVTALRRYLGQLQMLAVLPGSSWSSA